MIKNCRQLIMNWFQIYRRIRLTVFVFIIDKFVLPRNNLLCDNITHLQLSEIRNELSPYDMLLCFPSVFFNSCTHIFNCSTKLLKFISKSPPSLLSCSRCFKPSFLRLFSLTVPIGVTINHSPSICLFFFINCHFYLFFWTVP